MRVDGSGTGTGTAMLLAMGTLRPIAEALDSLGIAMCVFDVADTTLLWNRTFLKFFPEHAAGIHVGEPYQENLRRFYSGRLDADEMPSIERYIEEGVQRHRAQQRPYVFDHRGLRLSVASLPLPGIGRVRIWRAREADVAQAEAGSPKTPDAQSPAGLAEAASFDHVADGVMVTGADDRITWVNEAFVVMYGVADRAAALGAPFAEVYRSVWRAAQAHDSSLYDQGLSILTEHMRFAGAPFELPLPGDRWSRVVAQRSPDGKSFFAHVDITVLKRQQRQLLAAERRARQSEMVLQEKSALLEATLQRMEQGVMMVTAEQVVEVCNRRARELLDLPPDLMDHRPTFAQVLAYQWSIGEFDAASPDLQAMVRAGALPTQPLSYDRERPNGRVLAIHSVPVDNGGVLMTYTDITERKRAEERIRHVARHDGLTSLLNREVFLEHLAGAAHKAQGRAGGFAVHYIDMDRFKAINDGHGHAVGDKVLALLARRLHEVVREDDVVARMGGDEFAVLQYGVEQAETATGLADRLVRALEQPMELESHMLQVGASIGIELSSAGDGDPDTLLRNADTAMYAAKAAGGGVLMFGADPAERA